MSIDTSELDVARQAQPEQDGREPVGQELSRAELAARLDQAIERAHRALLATQHGDGYWMFALTANAQMNAEYIMFNRFMERSEPQLEQRLAKYLLQTQQPDGSWNLFHGGAGHLTTTVEAYAALKLAGGRAGDDHLTRARRWILAKGGIAQIGVLARFYLAALGQVSWEATPAVPPEIALLPRWFPVHMYKLSAWARPIVSALMLLQATRPVTKIPYVEGVLELYILPPHFTRFARRRGEGVLSLCNLFNLVDRVLAVYERHALAGLRARALLHLEQWVLERQDANGSWAGIQPCYLLTAMGLKGLGYRLEHPVLRKALAATHELIWELGDKALCQPCVSPVWDTALAAKALLESDLPADHASLKKAADWLVKNQILRRGDWAVKRPGLAPGGWAFQFYNEWYPDVDDAAVVLCVLANSAVEDMDGCRRALASGARWVMGMQSSDGGFAAFDADNTAHWLNKAPFADVEAVTDPTCADVTGRVLEMMGAVGIGANHPVAVRAINWLKRHQESDGSWRGRWGVNYIYGCFSVLAGLRAVGADMSEPWIKRAVQWLKLRQNTDGGWGESCLSDKDAAYRGRGPSTASQTAWALIGLAAAEDEISEATVRGAQWLLERADETGLWQETEFTGTGFPNHFYLHYAGYARYFPLMALGRLRRRLGVRAEDKA
jgi:squalene-hopene/tetraprenyl-beta-curcumene cyclase